MLWIGSYINNWMPFRGSKCYEEGQNAVKRVKMLWRRPRCYGEGQNAFERIKMLYERFKMLPTKVFNRVHINIVNKIITRKAFPHGINYTRPCVNGHPAYINL